MEAAPTVDCAPSQGPPARISWSVPLGQVDCLLTRCDVDSPRLLAAGDGSVWVVGDAAIPGGGASIGTALLRFDAEGNRSFGITVDARTRLSGPAPLGGTMKADARGHLLWIAPMTSEPGVELRDYDTSGRLLHAWPLVQTITHSGGAILGPASVLLLYGYDRALAGLPDAGPVSTDGFGHELDIARFDPPRGMVWNFTVSSAFGPDLKALRGAPASDGLLLFGKLAPLLEPERFLMAHVNDEGKLDSRFESSTVRLSDWQALADGTIILQLSGGGPLSPASPAVAIDPLGAPVWRVPEEGFVSHLSWVAANDARAWADGSAEELLQLSALSSDGRRCATFEMSVQVCTVTEDETRCAGVSLGPDTGGRVFFSHAGNIGLAQIDEVP
jgi:hypothetical protein